MDGVLLIDKPAGWTSHDVVNRVRRLVNTRRVGHLGTLDPLATGVLALVIERATRLAQFFKHSDKHYDAVVRFGYSTDSYDRDGTPATPVREVAMERAAVEAALEQFRGEILQTPPSVSAKKVAGVPAYKMARKKIPVELAPVVVTIHSLELVDVTGALARLRVHCSSGTYVRAIAHELGQKLGCGAVLEDLVRTQLADFRLEDCVTLDHLTTLAGEDHIAEVLLPCESLLPHFPSEYVDQITEGYIRHGRDFHVSPFRVRPGTRYVKAVSHAGRLLAIGEAKLPNLYHPILVL